MPIRRHLSDEQRWVQNQEIARRFKAGEQLRDLAVEYGLSKSGVYRIALATGHVAKRKPALWKLHIEAIIADYLAGVKTDAICWDFSLDQRTMYKILKRHGIVPNRGEGKSDTVRKWADNNRRRTATPPGVDNDATGKRAA